MAGAKTATVQWEVEEASLTAHQAELLAELESLEAQKAGAAFEATVGKAPAAYEKLDAAISQTKKDIALCIEGLTGLRLAQGVANEAAKAAARAAAEQAMNERLEHLAKCGKPILAAIDNLVDLLAQAGEIEKEAATAARQAGIEIRGQSAVPKVAYLLAAALGLHNFTGLDRHDVGLRRNVESTREALVTKASTRPRRTLQ